MEKVKTTVRFAVMILAVLATLSLAQFGGLTPIANAEGGSGQSPNDSISTPEPTIQPDEIGIFAAFGFYLEALF